ncbi:MAG: GAF domain-containing protein [Anaerolineae bacterium]
MSQHRTVLKVAHASDRVTAEIEADIRAWRQRLLNVVLITASGAAMLVSVGNIWQAARDAQRLPQAVLYLAITAFLVTLAVLRQVDHRLRAWGLFVLGYMMLGAFLVGSGLLGPGLIFLLALPVLGSLVLGLGSGLALATLSMLVYGVFALAAGAGWVQGPAIAGWTTVRPMQWLSQGLLLGFVLMVIVVVQSLFARMQKEALQAARDSAEELGTARDQLQFRTEELDRYARLLEVSTRITREVTGLLEPQVLLARAVDLIAEHLGPERAEIYLVGEDGGEPWLEAAAVSQGVAASGGDDIPAAVARAVRVPLQEGGIPFDDRGLPRELALPLEVGTRVAGALYLCSTRPLVADRDELVVLQAVADQVAIALENAQLYGDAQSSLCEIDALYRHYAAESWQHFLAEKPRPVQRWGSREIGEGSWQPLFEEARTSGKPATGVHAQSGHHLLAFPIKLRDVAIGVLGFQRPPAAGPWRMADIAAIEAVSARLALIGDNLRLLDQTQRRAAQERLTSQATARMRESLDVETVLSTAVDEIAGVLGLAALDLRLVGHQWPAGEGPEGWQAAQPPPRGQ